MRVHTLAATLASLGALATSPTAACSSGGGTQPASDSGSQASEGGGAMDGAEAVDSPVDGGGTSNMDATVPGIDPGKKVASLTTAELGQLCDWEYTELGGYGQHIQCMGSTIVNPANQNECIANMTYQPGCNMTVGQFEACIEREAPSQGCDQSFAECQPMFLCYPAHDS